MSGDHDHSHGSHDHSHGSRGKSTGHSHQHGSSGDTDRRCLLIALGLLVAFAAPDPDPATSAADHS